MTENEAIKLIIRAFGMNKATVVTVKDPPVRAGLHFKRAERSLLRRADKGENSYRGWVLRSDPWK